MINEDSSVLITGGTGSFGKAFVKKLLQDYPKIKRLVIYSRDELKQYEMANTFNLDLHPGLRFFIGDIRDKNRLKMALREIDVVIHAAALKQVPAAEYNPFEFIKTNVIGAHNLIEASLECSVKTVIALSTDKAASPINLYGATKLCSDKLFIAANNVIGKSNITFSVVRYGNVMGSRGSVIPRFLELAKTGVLLLTDPNMTRFNLRLEEAVDFVIESANSALGGEIFVPKIPSYRLMDLARAICNNCKIEITGIRPGEKLHEEMITKSDSLGTVEFDRKFIITQPLGKYSTNYFIEHLGAKKVSQDFSYSSENNDHFLSVHELSNLINSL